LGRAEDLRKTVQCHGLVLRAELYVVEVRFAEEVGVELPGNAVRGCFGKTTREGTKHQQKAICASEQDIVGSKAAGNEVEGVGAHAFTFIRPAIAIAGADFGQADELELRHIKGCAPLRQPANPFGEVQPALRFSLVAHPHTRRLPASPPHGSCDGGMRNGLSGQCELLE
jgi:hypothetical protein